MKLNYNDIINILEYIEKSEYNEMFLETDGIVIKASKEGLIESSISQGGRNNDINHETEEKEMKEIVEEKVVIQHDDEPKENNKKEVTTINENCIEVLAPMMGTYYRSPSPSEPPYISVGDNVNEETPIGLIEVMKLFNTVPSTVTGKVMEILVEDGELVEKDQPLLIIECK